ncbi:hypothetical protein FisN_5Lh293 [Fistulifera solaris]|uniref:Uncharacterized protein n=1 Tax=Fistulifera solaris TaxID=1519565 RepID=A0A1Z5KGM0_FISSO|nr:hypothetical protein FisN_5Lh293 [Fistulifera solaris]|eukprot:GAX25211.1 hypothetical protein FisN_5Lh293 [Fistulifera solaris]
MAEYLSSPKKKSGTLGDSFHGSFHSISELGSDGEDFEDESVVVVESDEEVDGTDSNEEDRSIAAETSNTMEDEMSTKTPRSVLSKTEMIHACSTPSPKDPSGRTHHLRIPPGRNTSFSDESFPKPRRECDSPPRRGVTRNISFDGQEGKVILSTLDKRTKPRSYKSSGSLEFMRSATRTPRQGLVRKLSVEDLFGPQNLCGSSSNMSAAS